MASIILSEANTILGVKGKRNRDWFDKNYVEIQEILDERNVLSRGQGYTKRWISATSC